MATFAKAIREEEKTSPHKIGAYVYAKPEESNKWQSKSNMAGAQDFREEENYMNEH